MKKSGKTGFILAFAALIITLNSSNPDFLLTKIDFGFWNPNIRDLVMISIYLLFISIYLYAIDSVRYGLPKIESWKLFKSIQFLAHLAYLFAIISPLFFVLMYFLNLGFKNFTNINVEVYSKTISILSIFTSLISTLFIMRTKDLFEKEKTKQKFSIQMNDVDSLIKSKKWRAAIIEAFRLLETTIDNKLKDYGINLDRISFSYAVRILFEKNILNQENLIELNKIRRIRNLAVHTNEKITKSEAENIIKSINSLINDLSVPNLSESIVEKEILKALSALFPPHHIIPQLNFKGIQKKIDFRAEGPNWDYLIEIAHFVYKKNIVNEVKKIKKLLNSNERGIVIVPNTKNKKIISTEKQIKILYFNFQKNKFINHKEIYDWIYKKNKSGTV